MMKLRKLKEKKFSTSYGFVIVNQFVLSLYWLVKKSKIKNEILDFF